MSNHKKPREEYDAMTRRMYEDHINGMTLAELADKYYCDIKTVRRRFIRLGLECVHRYQKPRLTSEDVEEIARKRQNCWKYSRLETHYELSRETIRASLKRGGRYDVLGHMDGKSRLEGHAEDDKGIIDKGDGDGDT